MIAWGVGDLAKTLGMPKENVRLVSPFIGGGFGGKLFLRADAVLAALGARAAGRPVKVALHAAADLQQHHAPAGDDPAHPHRRRPRRQDHRDRPRELVRQPAGRQARDGGQPDAAALRRRQPADRDAARGARPARRQRDARARRGAGHDGARDRDGRDGREARASIRSSSASSTTRRSIPEKPERPFSQRQLVECLRIGAERFGWSQRNAAARPGARRPLAGRHRHGRRRSATTC